MASTGQDASHIAALTLSTYLHSLLALDGSLQPLSPVTTWADTRSAAAAEQLRASSPDLYPRTGCPPHPMYPLTKLMWLRAHSQDLWASTPRWGSIKDLLVYRLTGRWAVDHSIASGSGLFQLNGLGWDADALSLVGVEKHQLPELMPTTAVLGLGREGAGLTGLREGTPVVIGAGDGMLSNLGAGAVGPGMIAVMVGTSGAVRATSTTPRVDPKGRTWCYNLSPDHWVVGGAISNGGSVLRWLRDRWSKSGESYEELTRAAARIPAGSDALIFLPLLGGERSPYWDSRARGALVGLGLAHGPDHMVRAALEGVAFQLKSVLVALEELVGVASEVRLTGGLSRSPFWRQLCADVFGRNVHVLGEAEGSAIGAFLLARHALGAEPDLLGAARRMTEATHAYAPDPASSALYERLYEVYEHTYWRLQYTYAALADMRVERVPIEREQSP